MTTTPTTSEAVTTQRACTACNGTGKVERDLPMACPYGGADWDVPKIVDCDECDGTGESEDA